MSPQKIRLRRYGRMSDEQLMTQLQEGGDEAFDELVRRHSRRILNYLYRFTGDWERSEDLVQETFLRVYRSRHSYRRIARFTTWLYTIAGNLARTEYRMIKRSPIYSIPATGRRADEFDYDVADTSSVPDEDADLSIQRELLLRALQQVPESFREVIVLRDVQDLAYDEIGEITGLPLGTVKSRIHRGRTLLQEMLHEEPVLS